MLIRSEKRSGTAIKGRDQLWTILDFIGDTQVVTKLDRLARSVVDLSRIVELLAGRGASLRVLDANIDTKDSQWQSTLRHARVFAGFETNLRRERQLEGIDKPKMGGIYKGRPASIDANAVRRLRTMASRRLTLPAASQSAEHRCVVC
jgi:DNA invertase Pin-like site-specific DNA recombinase